MGTPPASRSSTTPAHGGRTAGEIHDGGRISFTPYDLDNATGFTARISSGGSGGTLEVRTGSRSAPCSTRPPCRPPAAGRPSRTSRRP
ncbi:carbohydrate-binding protein [Streptomyces sp. NRRL F-2305]|uniref:carbohydrate-binding protein n=1 Tax=Streptomyces TaxID=1883 RepID=UPI0036FA0ECF